MKFLPLIVSMVASTVCGTFAVTSWAVEGTARPVELSATFSPGDASGALQATPRDGGAKPLPAYESGRGGLLRSFDAMQTRSAHIDLGPMASDGADFVGGVRRRG